MNQTMRWWSTPRGKRLLLVFSSFLLPLTLWALVSYVPFIWHPDMEITDPGGVDYFQTGMLIDKATFRQEVAHMEKKHLPVPQGYPANPIYLPTPGQVGEAFVHGLVSPPPKYSQLPSLPESMWSSIQLIFWGFFISSLIGVPLGILAGTYAAVGRLSEPFIEFFRYLPAPAFGPLAVAVLGIFAGPKITIIVIGTFFQQVLIIANTARRLDGTLIEAARTLGTRRLSLLTKVVIPGILPELYRDQRILLGWAWTYLIVAELVGTSSGITWYITQQARYQHFSHVYAGIAMIGVVGFGIDLILGKLSRYLFPWDLTLSRQ